MNFDRLTTMSQQALQEAASAATTAGNPEVLPEHLLLAILAQSEGIGRPLLDLAGVRVEALAQALTSELSKLPRVEGGGRASSRATHAVSGQRG